MKKNGFKWQTLLLVSLFSFVLVSCGGDSDDDAPATELSVDVAQLTLSADGQSQTFRITSNADWTITGNPSWLTVTPSAGSKNKNIVVTANENTQTAERTCELRIITDDGQAYEVISVKQSAKEGELAVDVTEINLDGKDNSVGSLRITSNTSWTISGVPDWLTLSSVNGNGTAQVTISANTGNNSASPRECVLSVMAGNIVKQVKVIQAGLLAANCNVTPGTIVVLATGIAFDYTYGSNVAYYHTRLYYPSQIERMTDAEIIAAMSADMSDRETPNDGYVTSWQNLTPLTEYTVCTIGFDKNGNHGELQKKTLKTKSGSNQAIATISDVKYNDTYWIWTTTVNGFVTRYAQGDVWNMKRNGGTVFDVVTWAVDVSGEFSGMIDRFVGRVDSSSKGIKKQSISKKENPFSYQNIRKSM